MFLVIEVEERTQRIEGKFEVMEDGKRKYTRKEGKPMRRWKIVISLVS
jgi:hypothetical protein